MENYLSSLPSPPVSRAQLCCFSPPFSLSTAVTLQIRSSSAPAQGLSSNPNYGTCLPPPPPPPQPSKTLEVTVTPLSPLNHRNPSGSGTLLLRLSPITFCPLPDDRRQPGMNPQGRHTVVFSNSLTDEWEEDTQNVAISSKTVCQFGNHQLS